MSREIKFRAWNKDRKEWANLFIKNGTAHILSHVDGKHEDWQQYTSLLDKNGKEIYEGDVVRAWEPETDTTTGELRMTVDDAFNCYAPLRDILIDKKDVEIIGNIYENPDLLKQ